MDQREDRIRENIEDTRTAVTEKIDMIEGRVHETMEGTKSTIDNVMNGIQRVQGTVEEAKSAVDNILETLKYTMEEAVDRVKSITELIEQVERNPWIMFGSAVMMGYVLGSVDYKGSFGSRHINERRNNAERERRTAESRP